MQPIERAGIIASVDWVNPLFAEEDIRSRGVEETARQYAEELWTADCRYAVVTCTPRRPGRGRTATGSNQSGWRVDNRPGVLGRLDKIASELVHGLSAGNLETSEAQERLANSGLTDAVHIVASESDLATVILQVMETGDNVWTDCSPDNGGVKYLKWWSDLSHQKC